MPYASDNRISKAEIPGGIEITEAEYKEALTAQLSGQSITVEDGALKILSKAKRTVYSTADKSELEIAENATTPDGYTDDAPGRFDEWDGSKWVKDEEAERKAQVPASVSRFQARQALKDAGLFSQVQQAVNGSDNQLMKDAWNEASEFDRDSPTIAALASQLGLTESDLDDLFITAGQIRA